MGILSNLFGGRERSARIEPRLESRAAVEPYRGSTEPAPIELKETATASGGWGATGLFGGLPTSTAGVAVTPYTALQAPTVNACVRCLSDDIAKMPLIVRRRLPGGGWEVDALHPLNAVLRNPNRMQSALDFKAYIVTSYCLRGNAYIAIRRDYAGRPRSLLPISPDRVTVSLAPDDGTLFYQVSHTLLGEAAAVFHQDDMMHIRGMSLDGWMGISPLLTGAEAIGLSLATQQHGAKQFSQGTDLRGVLSTDGKLSPEAGQRVGESWRNTYSGTANAGRIAILEEGLTFTPISMTNEAAQYLATREMQVAEIARIFRVPLHKIMDRGSAAPGTLEQAEIAYVRDGLQPIAQRIEEAADADLLFEDEQRTLSLRFDFDELLRGDAQSRFAVYQTGLLNGVFNIDHVRAREGLPPLPDGLGKTHRTPLNTGAVGQVDPNSAAAVTAPKEPAIVVPPNT